MHYVGRAFSLGSIGLTLGMVGRAFSPGSTGLTLSNTVGSLLSGQHRANLGQNGGESLQS
jgi:hypothetical protein